MSSSINSEQNAEDKQVNDLIRALQNETSCADWGDWHFSLLNLAEGENLYEKICNTLRRIPHYQNPYSLDPARGTTYIASWDLKNLKLEPVADLRTELISKAEHWSHYQGPTSNRKSNSERFNELNVRFADQLIAHLSSKEIMRVRLVSGIDTFYSFGGDHCGDDILIETECGVYVVHFGFSS